MRVISLKASGPYESHKAAWATSVDLRVGCKVSSYLNNLATLDYSRCSTGRILLIKPKTVAGAPETRIKLAEAMKPEGTR